MDPNYQQASTNVGVTGDPLTAINNNIVGSAVGVFDTPGMQDPQAAHSNLGGFIPDMGTPRGSNWYNIPGNIALDIADMGQGLAAMGSFAIERTRAPLFGQSPIRDGDLEGLQRITSGIVDHYHKAWIDPIIHGDFGSIGTNLTQHPLDLFDVAPIPAVKALKIPQAAKLIPGVNQLGKVAHGIEQAAMRNEFTRPIVEGAKTRALQGGIKNEVAELTSQEYQQVRASLDEKLKSVPPADQQELVALMEGSAPRYFQPGFVFDRDLHPATRDYIETARPIIAKGTQMLKELGSVSAEQVYRDRWLSAASAAAQVFQLTPQEMAEIAKNPQAMEALIRDSKAYLNRRGIEPIYQGRMTEGSMKQTLAHPYRMPDYTLRAAADKARASVEGEIPTARTSMEYARTALERGNQFSTDSRGVTLARYAQVLQLYNATKVLLNRMLDAQADVSRMTEKQIADAGLVPFNAREFLGKIGGGLKVFTDNELQAITANTIGEKIYLPHWMVGAIERATHPTAGTIEKTLAGFANFARRYVLGFNFTLPEDQFAQTLVMLGMTQFRGPRDTILSLMSYTLAFDKQVQSIIPKHILPEQFVSDAGTQLLPGRAGKAVEKVIDFNFWRLGVYDTVTRYVAAGYYALKLSEKVPELGGPIRGMLSSGEALERMRGVFASPEHTNQVNKSIIQTLGDYSALQSEKRALLRTTFLWWNWIEAITKHVAMLPSNHPYKFAIGQRLAWASADLMDPNLPVGMRQAGAVRAGDSTNPQGIPLYVVKGSMNPYSAVAELAEQIGQPIAGEESSTLLSQMNPVFPIFTAVALAFNPSTGEEFHSPNLVQYHGKQFKYEDLKRGVYKSQHPRPNVIEYFARTLLPAPTRFAERVYAKVTTGGEPSQFTTLGVDPAPRTRFNSGGRPIEAAPLHEIALETLAGMRRIPIDTSGYKKMEQMQKRSINKALQSAKSQLSPDALRGHISNQE